MKKAVLIGLAVLVTAGNVFSARKDEVTLVLMPRDESVTRLGLDLAQRYPTLLVSYQNRPNGTASFHGWTGKEWVNIQPDAFQAGDFFRTAPDSALLVERAGSPFPEEFVPAEAWCAAVYKIKTAELRPLLHLTGQYYDFGYRDWKWFSENYKLPMDAINPEGLNIAWYHRQLRDNLAKRDVGADDLQYWEAVRHPTPPPVVEKMAAEEAPAVDESAETNAVEAVELPEEDLGNPLTNDVPEAVVLSPANAEEAREIPAE